MEKISAQYNEAVQLIKSAIVENQLEAAKAVNRKCANFMNNGANW